MDRTNAGNSEASKLSIHFSGGDSLLLRTKYALLLSLALMGQARAQDSGTIKEIVIRGNATIAREAITTAMRSKEGGPFLQAQLAQDEASVRDLGFFKDVKVLSRDLGGGSWQIIVEVEENPVIKEVRITGSTVFKTEELLPLVTQPIGKIFNFNTVLPTTEAISKKYQDKGYFARVDVVPLTDSPNTLNLVVVERAVNDIILTGLTRTRPSVIRRMMRTKPGKAFNEELWIIDRRRLDSTQWFESIEAKTQQTDDIGKFNLLMDFKEARTAQIGLGLSLDPRSRLAGSIRYSDTNTFGTGQTTGATFTQDTGGAGASVYLDYVNPFMDSRGSSMAVRAYSRVNTYFSGIGIGNNDSPNDQRFDERRTGGSIAFGTPFGRDWSGSVGTTFEAINTINLQTTGSTNYIQQDGTLGVLSLGLARDRRDVPLDPAEGDYFRLLVEPALSNITKIGGDVGDVTDVLGRHTFVRNTLEYKAFFSKRPPKDKPIDTPRHVIAYRARYGIISGTVPFFEQFFVGGSDSLRGYSDQRFWGKQQFVTSLEYRFPIQKTFNIIPFVDYGGAWGGYGTINNFVQYKDPKFFLGYGVGIGFKTPLGAIRIDFGFNQQGGSRTHFSIGGSF